MFECPLSRLLGCGIWDIDTIDEEIFIKSHDNLLHLASVV